MNALAPEQIEKMIASIEARRRSQTKYYNTNKEAICLRKKDKYTSAKVVAPPIKTQIQEFTE